MKSGKRKSQFWLMVDAVSATEKLKREKEWRGEARELARGEENDKRLPFSYSDPRKHARGTAEHRCSVIRLRTAARSGRVDFRLRINKSMKK
mmetsp:Transcript_39017/g.76746  ORF Transcript_39017/g.76746 Transcript_39017/m.76746 type:complete len:92 (+) Transcript_39017:1784-2059(+)